MYFFLQNPYYLPSPIYNVHRYHQFYAKTWRNQLPNRLFGDVVDRWLYDGKRISHPFPRFFCWTEKVMEMSLKAYGTRGETFGNFYWSNQTTYISQFMEGLFFKGLFFDRSVISTLSLKLEEYMLFQVAQDL